MCAIDLRTAVCYLHVYIASSQQICTKDFDQPSGWTVIPVKDTHSKYSCVGMGNGGVCAHGCMGGFDFSLYEACAMIAARAA